MAHKTFGFTVDFNNRKRLAVANVKQNDTAVFNILLVEDGKPVDLTNQQIRLFINKPDNKLVVQDDNITVVDAKRGSIRINVKNSAFQAVGTAVAELDVWGTNQENASSQNFFIEVDEQLGSNDAVNSYVDVNLFRQLTEYIDTANTNIAKYKATFEAFTKAGVSLQGLIDIRSYIDNNLSSLKAQGDRADKLSKELNTESNTAKELIKTLNETTKANKTALNDALEKVAETTKTLTYSTNLPKMRSDIDKNILRIDQHTRDINTINAEIKDIKENGIIGGSGMGGGNNTAPTITTDFTKRIFTVDDSISIPYFIVDGEGGKMKAFYTINDVQQKPIIVDLGTNTWDIGKLPKGSYKLKIYVSDRGGLYSNQLIFDIQVGALELTSTFNDKIDYKLNEEIIIGYNISSMGKQLVNLTTVVDGVKTTKETKIGFNNLNLGVMSKGIHKITLQAGYDAIVSNVLTFNIIVTDSSTLFLTSDFTGKGLTNADYISIPYRISLQGQKQFIVHASVNDSEKPLLTGILGVNQLQLGYLSAGIYTVKIYATTVDGKETSNTLSLQLNIAQSDFKLAEYVKDGLLLDLSAVGKTNASADKNTWVDKSPYNRKVTLNNFNFVENGWIDDCLVINGKANAEMDVTPFTDNCPKGVTIELYFKYKENSENKCNFAQCYSKTGLGFYVNDEYTYLNSSVDSIKYPLESDELIHVAYVIDWNTKFEYIYINGCISTASLLYDSTNFASDEKLKIGACLPDTLVDCAFRYVRVYDRALDHTEILTNFTSCKDIDEQKEIVRRNGENALPEMNIQGNFDGMGKDLPVKLKIDFRSKGLAGSDFSLPSCPVEWQGDSTLQYAVKNYSIKLYQESGDKYKVQPKANWPKTHRVWAKANMMDSSSATSAGVGHMFACLYKEKTPPMMDKRSSLYTVDSFPILMYHNDKFAGVYTWMLPPKANPLGLDKEKPYNYNFGCEENAGNGIGAFNLKDSIGADAIPTKEQILNGWSCYSDTDGNAFQHFATLLKWVNDCYWAGTDNYTKFPDFREKVAKKFNLPFLIDYWIYCQVFGLVDSLGKNLQLYSFGTMNDEGEPIWYTTFFDFDTGLGCDNKGEFIWPPDMNCPEDYNTPHNLLWEMLRHEFKEEIKARYIELRRSNLNTKKFKEVFYDGIIHTIGEKYYNMDALNKYFVWGSGYIQMFHGNKWLELRKWFRERLIYLDTMYGYTGDLKHTIVLRNTHNGQVELNVKVDTPQFITASFGGAESANDGNVITKKCTEDNYTTFRYSYNGSYQKDAYITSASQITDLKGLAYSNLIMLDVQYANKLKELNIDNNPALTALHMDNCSNLESFSAKNCTALTSVLNFNNSPNLKSIDISGSGVQGIIYDKCLNLENLNIQGSALRTFISDHSTLNSLNITGCTNIKDFEIKNSDTLTDIIGLDHLNLSGAGKMIFDNLTNIKKFSINTQGLAVHNYLNVDLLNMADVTFNISSGLIDTLTLKNMKNFTIDGSENSVVAYKAIILDNTELKAENIPNDNWYYSVENGKYINLLKTNTILKSTFFNHSFFNLIECFEYSDIQLTKDNVLDINMTVWGGLKQVLLSNINFVYPDYIQTPTSRFNPALIIDSFVNKELKIKVLVKTIFRNIQNKTITLVEDSNLDKISYVGCKNVTVIKPDGTREIINN